MSQGHDQLFTVSPVSPQPANRARKYGNLGVLYYTISSIHAVGTHKTLERSSLYNKFRSREQQITKRPSLPPLTIYNTLQDRESFKNMLTYINVLYYKFLGAFEKL